MLETLIFYMGQPCEVLVLWYVRVPQVGVVRVTWAISALWTLKFHHSKLSVYRRYSQVVRNRFVYDTYRTVEATWSRHGWVHMFITHRPTLTLQLNNFDLFRTCRTSSFCTVAWQLARFQLTWRIARSLGDSRVSCLFWSYSRFGSV